MERIPCQGHLVQVTYSRVSALFPFLVLLPLSQATRAVCVFRVTFHGDDGQQRLSTKIHTKVTKPTKPHGRKSFGPPARVQQSSNAAERSQLGGLRRVVQHVEGWNRRSARAFCQLPKDPSCQRQVCLCNASVWQNKVPRRGSPEPRSTRH
jgi:hypothetical protein